MPTVNDIVKLIEKAAPAELSCDWDNDGLQVCPNADAEVTKCLICLDVCNRAIDEAVSFGAQMIVTHHPLMFDAFHSITQSTPEPLMAQRLYTLGISQLSAHTRLDYAMGGVCDTLAAKLGLVDCEPFESDLLGRVGNIEKMTGTEFVSYVKEKLGTPHIRYIGENKTVVRVAVVGGSGKEYLDDAISAGADAFVTGDVSYNVFLSAERRGILLADAGHYFTEFPVCEYIRNTINTAYPDIQTKIYYDYPVKEI